MGVGVDGRGAKVRRLRVRHVTTHRYERDVERSRHRLHLRPVDDWRQRLTTYRLEVKPVTEVVEYEDVFGNWTQRFDLRVPYREVRVAAESVVELLELDPFAFLGEGPRPRLPVSWMQAERVMLAPYLTPEELPDTQLEEMEEFAKAIAKENGDDLLETLFAINLKLFREFRYAPGTTTLTTTAYDVFVNRTGVCQDFANVFIMLARLLGLPARYVCGYIFTGNTGKARAGSDATHAWVQVYIPAVGWKGFDPTIGVLPATGHVRTAVGRHFRDATPTAGTLFGPPAGVETMAVEVEVSEDRAGGVVVPPVVKPGGADKARAPA